VTPEAEQYLKKARQCLAHAITIIALPIPEVAGKEAYLAGYHAAEAVIFERTGKTVKTHKGIRTSFARLSINEPILREFTAFLAQGYELKSLADYGVDPDVCVSVDDAKAAIEAAGRFLKCIEELLNPPIVKSPTRRA
jgi:uncharacterized protein (UPF0332 family)